MKVRRGFVSIAWQKLIRLDFSWAVRQAKKYHHIRKAIRRADGKALCGPVIAHFFCTRRCNLKCPMCDIPNWEGGCELDTKAAIDIIDQAAALGISGISFTGGEPLLRNDIFQLLEYAKSRGLETILVTNGLRLYQLAQAVCKAAPDIVNVSIDGSKPEVHDLSRGVTGAFEQTLKGIAALRQRIDRQKSRTRLVASTVLSADNIADLGALIDLCDGIGMDRIIICPLHRFNGDCCQVAPLTTAMDVQQYLMKHPKRNRIDNSDRYLSRLNSVLKGDPPPAGCRAGYTTLLVDDGGNVYPCKCYFENRIKLTDPVSDQNTLAGIWYSDPFDRFRRTCGECRRCYLTINREFDGLFG